MRLHSDLYKNILVMTVSQFVSPKSIETLNENFKKLEALKIEFIFINLTTAMVSDDALAAARATKILRTHSGLKGVYYIGELTGLCEYRTLDQALKSCPAAEASLIRNKFLLESEINKLKIKQIELEKDQTDSNLIQSQVYRLSLENRQLKRLKQSMAQEIEQVERTKKNFEKKKPNPTLIQEFEEVKSEILRMVADMGVK